MTRQFPLSSPDRGCVRRVFSLFALRKWTLQQLLGSRVGSSLAVVLSATLLAVWSWGTAEKSPVFVTASLIDQNNLFIEDLAAQEIKILENGQPRQLELMAKDELPMVCGLLFDRGMLQDPWERERKDVRTLAGSVSARDIAYELIDKYLGRQVVWVGVYDKELEVAVDFSSDGFRTKDAIHQLRASRQSQVSYLYGALLSTVQKMNERVEKRRVLFLFLDSIDTETAGKAKLLKNLLSSANLELFAVNFSSKLGSTRWGLHPQMVQSFIMDMAQVTAGNAFFATDYGAHREDISRHILNQVRTFYTFGFQSESAVAKPADLVIKCTRPGAKIRHHPTILAVH